MIHITPGLFHRVWLVVFAIVVAVEIWAIRRAGPDDTMSEWVWSKTHSAPVKMLIAALLVWLFYHVVWSGPGKGLSWRDALSILLGAAAGLVAYLTRPHA